MFIALMIAALAQAAAQPAETDKADQVVCRREAPIGSHVPGRRVCKKRSEWVAKSRIVPQEGRTMPSWQRSGFAPGQN